MCDKGWFINMHNKGTVVAFFSKEMTSIIRFSHLTPIRVDAIIQPFFMGKEMADFLSNFKEIPVYESFEAAHNKESTLLLIGFTKQLSKMRNIDYLYLALDFAVCNKLNVFSFDNIYHGKYNHLLSQMNEKGLNYYCPLVHKKRKQVRYFENGPFVSKDPNGLMILGTSSNQGKFTLMLQLISELKKRKIKFGTIGSEHQSALFGINSVFPYGVTANVMIPMVEYPGYLQKELKKIYKGGAKYVLACSQSGILPYSLQDIYNKSFTLATISFYLSLMPGKVVLVVNSGIDSISFIRETINFIEYVGQADVVALAFSNMERTIKNDVVSISSLEQEDVFMIKQRYYIELGLKSFNIMDNEDIKSLVDLLVCGAV